MQRLLIANRGEVASRIARSARRLGIASVGIYSEPDAGLPYLNDVDEAVALRGATAPETYLDIEKVISAAKGSVCDAIHPGYGFLAENADFAAAVTAAGITFVGPSADCVAAMGSKVRAKELARKASVPVLPDAVIGTSPEEPGVAALAADVGYPLLVKASAGGGGRGIRLVESPDDLADAVDSARREAAAAFGDDTVFLERFLSGPRHVEIQVFGDTHGNVVHLGDRECSVQRRHQKLIEEAPAVCVSPRVRDAMAEAALRLAKEIGYIGAGTCEFLVQGDEFYFLEMNARLQVEHTVTEQVTGMDLVALQLAVADGDPLGFDQSAVSLQGHAIQARVCAEDPQAGWLPSTGLISRYVHPSGAGLRYEDGIESGSVISPYYDSMITKVIATGENRDQAVAKLSAALRGIALHGPVTNIAALVGILGDDDYRRGEISVNWLESRPDLAEVAEPLPVAAVAAAVVSAVVGTESGSAVRAAWSNTERVPVTWEVIDHAGGIHEIAYLPPISDGADFPLFSVDGTCFSVRHIETPMSGLEGCWRVEVGGRIHVLTVTADADLSADGVARVWVNGGFGQVDFEIAPRFTETTHDGALGGPTSPMPGTVLAVHVEPGQQVSHGQPLVVVEAMKMEHVIKAAQDAVVEKVLVEIGQSVEAGRILVQLQEA